MRSTEGVAFSDVDELKAWTSEPVSTLDIEPHGSSGSVSSTESSEPLGHYDFGASFWHDVLDRSAAATLLLDEFGVIGVESAQWSRYIGRAKNGSIGSHLLDLVHVANADGVREAFLRMAAGKLARVSFEFTIELSPPTHQTSSVRTYSATGVNALLHPTIGAIIVTVFDVTERKALEQTLRYNANHDPLTGLTNRRAVMRTLTQWVADAQRTTAKPAVMLLDLDGFKSVNDAYGHAAGDALLVEVANRLKNIDPGSLGVARFGATSWWSMPVLKTSRWMRLELHSAH